MNWKFIEAIEKQIKLIGLFQDFGDPGEIYSGLNKKHQDILSHAQTYFIESDICSAIIMGFKTLPDLPLVNVYKNIPGKGFVYLAQPFQMEGERISCFSWSLEKDEQKYEYLLISFYNEEENYHSDAVWWLNTNYKSDFDETFIQGNDINTLVNDINTRDMLSMRQLIYSFFAFIMQPIIIIDKNQCPRATRKRLEKYPKLDPSIKVLHLRKRLYDKSPSPTKEHINWSCRWLVNGHWRNQWYPKEAINKPKFITPYLKGPNDKALKSFKWNIISVDR